MMELLTINPLEDDRWQQLLQRYQSSVFHSPTWLLGLRQTYDLDIQARVLTAGAGSAVAGLLYCDIADMRGERRIMIPFSDFTDPLVDNLDQWCALTADLFQRDMPVSVRCLHNDVPLQDERLAKVNRAKWHGLDISPSADELWQNLDPSARRAIRKAEKSGVESRIVEDEAGVRAFFDMHLGVRKYKYGLLAQPYEFIANIWRNFHQDGRAALMLATLQDEVVGGVMYLEDRDTLYYKFSASSRFNLAVRPTDLLIWHGIQHAQSRGLKRIDFGLSDWDQDGLVRYKRKFASEEKEISFLRSAVFTPPTAAQQQAGALLGALTGLFTDESVPDVISERAGELLYRYFV